MTGANLLAELARLRVRVCRGRNGEPILDGIMSDEIVDTARASRWLFEWGLQGAGSGHRWYACDKCGELQLLARERSCGMTPKCGGRMRPIPSPAFWLTEPVAA